MSDGRLSMRHPSEQVMPHSPDLNTPVDEIHADCLLSRRWVNQIFLEAKIRAAKWEPLPCPKR